mmetsp:Transcript_75697/g.225667  ORF Transcript_75697/g.225667 Transcript_75697/m.225667 type:complete len:205 (+) Transcript_75697:539-1153(+)
MRRPLSRTRSATTCETSFLCSPTMSTLARDHSTLEAESTSHWVGVRPESTRAVGASIALESPRTSSGKRVRFQAARESVSNVRPGGGVLRSSCMRRQSLRTGGCRTSSSRSLKELLFASVFSASSATAVVKFAPLSLMMFAHFTALASSICFMISLFSCVPAAGAAGAAEPGAAAAGAAAASAAGWGGAGGSPVTATCCCHCWK